jgi:cytoskeleton protein RodZ
MGDRTGGAPVPRAELQLKTLDREEASQTETQFTECSDAPRAGADLRAARERLGWDLPDVAAMLRIRSFYLEALENGRLTNLPGNVYAVGFLRTYATALGLDVEEVSRRFRAEVGEMPRHSELIFPVPIPERGLPAGALILLGLILVGSAYIGWYRLSGEGRLPAETVPPVPARLAALVDAPRPVLVPVPAQDEHGLVAATATMLPAPPPDEDIGQFEPRRAVAEIPRLQPPPLPAAPAPIEELRMTSMPGGAPTTAIAMPVPPPVHPPDTAPQSGAAPGSPAAADGGRIVLRFTGDTWVQVKERGGEALLTKVMRTGEAWPVPDRGNLILNTGNAGRIEILVDGAEVPSIGSPGSVRKDVPLDVELLKAGAALPVSGRR